MFMFGVLCTMTVMSLWLMYSELRLSRAEKQLNEFSNDTPSYDNTINFDQASLIVHDDASEFGEFCTV